MTDVKTELSSLVSSGQIVAFPLASRISTVRRCAAELESKHGPDAVLYWRTECRRLADQLLAVGCDEDEMRRQVSEFQNEVQAEMARRHWPEQSAEANNS